MAIKRKRLAIHRKGAKKRKSKSKNKKKTKKKNKKRAALARPTETITGLTRAGSVVKNIDVRLSYKIVELFSDGLYRSANKAFEELVSNGFDAGARNVLVTLPEDVTAPDATIAVVDDGLGMNALGLEQLWEIGNSGKRELEDPPLGRKQIGKFGIGKLATYVLARRLTYVCRQGREYFVTSMNFDRLDRSASQVGNVRPMTLRVRKLSAAEARKALKPWTQQAAFEAWATKLFGPGSATTWTLALLSGLKDKAAEIEPGRLQWILRTALPLRDDFSINFNGKKLSPSKATKGRVGRWVIGKDVKKVPKPGPQDLKVRPNTDQPRSSVHRHGLFHPQLGRVTGYVEAYKGTLTGKSDQIGRSYGYFVYVRGRLVNIDDEYFGIDSNLLRHGTFSRFRCVVHIDDLDDELRSARESLREGPTSELTRNLMHSLFNFVRPKVQEHDEGEAPGARISERLAATPASLTGRPLIALVRSTLEGESEPRYVKVPPTVDEARHDAIVKSIEERVASEDGFVSDVALSDGLSIEDGIAVYDTETGALHINAKHPFVGAFADDFLGRSRFSLELFAMAEVLLESHLHHLGFETADAVAILEQRDELLRFLARSSGRRTALSVSQALQDARNNQDQLEHELVACFEILGFEAGHIGGKGKADGIAKAHLSADERGQPRNYSLSLEAKSKRKDGDKVSAKDVGISRVARHREDLACGHAVVVGPDFPTSDGESSALGTEMARGREKSSKTITLIRIDDLARLVRMAPRRALWPDRLRELFETRFLPDDAKAWIDEAVARRQRRPPYRRILDYIWEEQRDDPLHAVTYSAVRSGLRRAGTQLAETDLVQVCHGMARMAPGLIGARDRTVELNAPPAKVLAAIASVEREYPVGDKD